MKVSIEVDEFTLTYNGQYPESGLYDLVKMAHAVLGVDESWIFGTPEDVLVEHFDMTPERMIRMTEDGNWELVPTVKYEREIEELRKELNL